MKHVIVTGATGFVGANLVRRLLRDGHELHLLVRPGYRPWRIKEIRADVRIHELALDDAASVTRVVARIRPEWIFHLAVHGAYSTQTDPREMVATNILGTINLVHACLQTGFEAFINTGSSSEYGFKDHAPPETEWLEPNSCYAMTKAAATLFCRFMAQTHQLPLVTLRLYSAFGPYEEPARLLPTLIVQGLAGRLPPLVNPEIARDFVYIEDIVDAYLLAAVRRHQELGAVYNVGTGIQTTLREVVDVAQRLLGLVAEPVWGTMSNRAWDTKTWIANNQKVVQQLEWTPRFTFVTGCAAMIEWFRDNPDWLAFYRKSQASE